MKKGTLLIIFKLVFLGPIAYSQTYREQFDKLNDLSSIEGTTSNVNGKLGGQCTRYIYYILTVRDEEYKGFVQVLKN
ncbi:MAG: hypothetical protein H0X46_07175 [Bacteroidetes bacterium]|nr:hypothetical protein [Bacteroidota bacterium]